jgi:DNA-binding NarL/FixJ family response regulator
MRVIIVEDDRATRERFAAALMGDMRVKLVASVGTAREAMGRVATEKPEVLLVDLGLPDMHGTEVIRYTARQVPDCDVMVISMFGDERSVIESIEAGATGYVLKDCGDADLVALIFELRAGGAPMSPGIARTVLKRVRSAALQVQDPPEPLTVREAEVLQLISRGYTYSEVAERMAISAHTVTSHIKNTYRKLAVHSAAAAVARAAELNLLKRS